MKKMKKEEEPMSQTLNYYNTHASSFAKNTQDVAFEDCQNRFLSHLKSGGTILDLGCGAGRDSAAFLKKGYEVTPVDGSKALCQIASEYLKRPVRLQLFEELDEKDAYDGIWACSSLLHVPSSQLPDIFSRIEKALKDGGIFYCSFKKGEFEGMRNGRYFTDLTEKALLSLIAQKAKDLHLMDSWISLDSRPDREDVWLNTLFRKEKQ